MVWLKPPVAYLAKMGREHVTVALNGDGGAENCAGYERYTANSVATWFARLPRFAPRALEVTARNLPDVGHPRGLDRRFFSAICQEPRRRYARWIAFFTKSWKAELFTPEFLEAIRPLDSLDLLLKAYESLPPRSHRCSSSGDGPRSISSSGRCRGCYRPR